MCAKAKSKDKVVSHPNHGTLPLICKGSIKGGRFVHWFGGRCDDLTLCLQSFSRRVNTKSAMSEIQPSGPPATAKAASATMERKLIERLRLLHYSLGT